MFWWFSVRPLPSKWDRIRLRVVTIKADYRGECRITLRFVLALFPSIAGQQRLVLLSLVFSFVVRPNERAVITEIERSITIASRNGNIWLKWIVIYYLLLRLCWHNSRRSWIIELIKGSSRTIYQLVDDRLNGLFWPAIFGLFHLFSYKHLSSSFYLQTLLIFILYKHISSSFICL